MYILVQNYIHTLYLCKNIRLDNTYTYINMLDYIHILDNNLSLNPAKENYLFCFAVVDIRQRRVRSANLAEKIIQTWK